MKKIISSLLATSMLLATAMVASAFTITKVETEDILSDDLKSMIEVSSWAQTEVEKAREYGLITEKNSYFLTSNITREQFAELVVNWVELELGKELNIAMLDTFTDTEDLSILKAYHAGIINGTGNDLFKPNDNATRQEIAVMLYRAINLLKSEGAIDIDTTVGSLTAYTDSEQVDSWAVDAVSVLASNGVMKGTSDTTLSPKNSCTKEQCIILVLRLFGN